MKIIKDEIYHIYNQGNNQGKVFFREKNYIFFLNKFREYIQPKAEILAYCLMPNHFHFMVNTTKDSVKKERIGPIEISALSNGFRLLLSTYAQAINNQEGISGSLFRQKTKAKLLTADRAYPLICFHYIHQNPVKAGLVNKMEDWEYSSFKDYLGLRNGSLCNQTLTCKLMGISKSMLLEDAYEWVEEDKIKKIT